MSNCAPVSETTYQQVGAHAEIVHADVSRAVTVVAKCEPPAVLLYRLPPITELIIRTNSQAE